MTTLSKRSVQNTFTGKTYAIRPPTCPGSFYKEGFVYCTHCGLILELAKLHRDAGGRPRCPECGQIPRMKSRQ